MVGVALLSILLFYVDLIADVTPLRRVAVNVVTAALKSTFRTTEPVRNLARLKMTGTVSATPRSCIQTNGLGEIPVRLLINN